MHKIINLTPEKNASRSVGVYVDDHLADGIAYIKTYGDLTSTDWLNFDKLVNESVVFMFVRNPYDRLISSFIHTCLSLDYVLDFPEWYFDLPINKENQLKCFKKFCLSFAKDGGIDNQHIKLQTKVIDEHVKMIDSKFGKPTGKFDNFSIIPYIENEKIFIGRVEYIKRDLPTLVLHFDDNLLVRTKYVSSRNNYDMLSEEGLKNINTTVPEWIGDNSTAKFSKDYRDWYDDELYDLMTPIFKKELEVLNYGF